MNAPSDEKLQNGYAVPPLWDGSFSCPCASTMCFSLSICNGKKNKFLLESQVGTQILWDDNVDGENGRGEEWIETPIFITIVEPN